MIFIRKKEKNIVFPPTLYKTTFKCKVYLTFYKCTATRFKIEVQNLLVFYFVVSVIYTNFAKGKSIWDGGGNQRIYVHTFSTRQIFLVRKALDYSVENILGLTGFDSRMRWYVSTRSVGSLLLNPSYQKFNWRKQIRSRCLIEEQ